MTDVTNYFPNPNGVTLVGGTRPKYFQGYDAYYELPPFPEYGSHWTITQTTVDGHTRVHSEQITGGSNNLNLVLGEGLSSSGSEGDPYVPGSFHFIGLEEGQKYIIRGTIYPTGSDDADYDPWAYLYGSDNGYGEHPLIGPGPWTVWATLEDTFGVVSGFTCWGFEAPVDVDNLMIYQGDIIRRMPVDSSTVFAAGTATDGAALGMVPGKSYVATGYTHGTFKVRTGTSSGTATDLVSWTSLFPGEWTGGSHDGVFTIPDGHTYISLEASGGYDAWIGILEYMPFFDGDTPDGDGYTYSWAGTANDSASIRSVATSSGSVTAQVHVGGVGVNVSEMKIAVTGGTLKAVTELGT